MRRGDRLRFALALAALLLVAASTGTGIPALKRLAADAELSGAGAGLFVAFHVAGTLLGAWALGSAARRRMGGLALRPTFVVVASASALANLALTRASGVAGIAALRFADGVLHVFLVSVLMSLAVSPDPRLRRAQTAWFGGTLVAGVGLGMAVGGFIAHANVRGPFVASALLCLGTAALGVVPVGARALAALPDRSGRGGSFGAGALLSGFVVGAERFAMGILTVLLPFLAASPRQAGAVLGTLVTSSLLIAPVAMALVRRRSPRAAWCAGGSVLALGLLSLGAVWTLAAPWGLVWAALTGGGAGLMYFGALANVSGLAAEGDRLRAMGFVHALGGAGFLVGSLLGGGLLALAEGQPSSWMVSGAAGLSVALALAALTRLRGPRLAPAAEGGT
jgi:MFS family permease